VKQEANTGPSTWKYICGGKQINIIGQKTKEENIKEK